MGFVGSTLWLEVLRREIDPERLRSEGHLWLQLPAQTDEGLTECQSADRTWLLTQKALSVFHFAAQKTCGRKRGSSSPQLKHTLESRSTNQTSRQNHVLFITGSCLKGEIKFSFQMRLFRFINHMSWSLKTLKISCL